MLVHAHLYIPAHHEKYCRNILIVYIYNMYSTRKKRYDSIIIIVFVLDCA